ncbi:hypothetical protein HYN46_01435 [Aquirhabdus parva]|uniref:Uncharacterized protein n=2 Tax=Aquirhabdus parva TaxID=2283318 RepID=A0A345P312_9GAMM|nr:hypothetical protein HYN46_01435 [Aquirhabdus parva]
MGMRGLCSTFIAPSLLLGSVLLPVSVWSMDALTDGQMDATTGQSGLSVLIIPNSVSNIPTIPIDSVTLGDSNGIPASSLAGYGSAASLRTDLTKVQFFGSASSVVDGVGNTINTGALNTYSMGLTMDVSGGGAAGAGIGANPTLSANLSLARVRTIGVFFNTNANSAGNLLGLVPKGANLAGALSVNDPTITPILSVGTYAYSGTAATPISTVSASPQRMNINFASDVSIGLKLGAFGSGPMIAFNNLNIASIDFNGQALNLESPNAGSTNCTTNVCSSRLSVTPSITGLNLTGATVDLLTTSQMQSVFSTATTGGLLLQESALSGAGMVFSSITAGTPGNVSTNTSLPAGTAFAAGMGNAPMGSFGVVGMGATNLKIGVSGM